MKKKILIIDDDAGLQDLFRIIFERAGYAITIESSADNIMHDNYELPDIFLVDRQLGGTDGVEVIGHLKRSERSRMIPVIMISAAPDINFLSGIAGADGFIEKPFNIRDLMNIIEQHIQKHTREGSV